MFGKNKKSNLLSLYAEEIRDKVSESLSLEKRRKRKQRIKLLNCLVWILVSGIVLSLLNLLALYPSVKKSYEALQIAKVDFLAIENEIKNNNQEQVKASLSRIDTNVSTSLTEIRKIKYSPICFLPVIKNKINDVENLLVSAKLIAYSFNESWEISKVFLKLLPENESFNYEALTPDEKRTLLASIDSTSKILPAVKANLTTANNKLDNIQDTDFFWQYGVDIQAFKEKIDKMLTLINRVEPMSRILPALAGYPYNAKYLILLQNYDEIRPTGGFIGTYGVGEVENGEIKTLETNDVYHLDYPVKDSFKQESPEPIKKYLGQSSLFFRDANWSPDWPTSADKLVWFYNEEKKMAMAASSTINFDFVIATTPDLFIDLLKITGPIEIRGETYKADNFVNLLQINTEKDYEKFGLKERDRKKVVGEIAKEMEKRLIAKVSKNYQEILDVLVNNLNSKAVMVYARDEDVAAYFKEKAWDGSIKQANDRDYLMVVDANLHALKTDAVMNKNISYKLVEDNNGLLASVNVNYMHKGQANWKIDAYQTFTRVYVPKGAILKKVAGFFGTEGDVKVGEENNHTWFGAYTKIEPGKMGNLYFEYYLPKELVSKLLSDGYKLDIQKQSGLRVTGLTVDLQFKQLIENYSPANLSTVHQGSRVTWTEKFGGDKYYEVKF